jgi:hypothetical protein
MAGKLYTEKGVHEFSRINTNFTNYSDHLLFYYHLYWLSKIHFVFFINFSINT